LKGVIGITGTPGTGKKSVAPLVAAKLGLRCRSLNELSSSLGVVRSPDGSVDTERLRRALRTIDGPAVLYGHLLPYALGRDSVSRVAVLRCEPSALKARLRERRYSERKTIENVEAELIGLESSDAYDTFGPSKTFEVDTTLMTPAQSAAKVLAVVKGARTPLPRLDWVPAYDSEEKLRSLLSGES
jgi:adenylate kinase